MKDSHISLVDGRKLAYTDIGESHWPCVVLFGGSPTSRLRIGYLEQARPWPFDSSRIRVPTHVVHGDLDLVLPLAHSRHTAERIPGSTLNVLPSHGHFTILSELPTLAKEVVT